MSNPSSRWFQGRAPAGGDSLEELETEEVKIVSSPTKSRGAPLVPIEGYRGAMGSTKTIENDHGLALSMNRTPSIWSPFLGSPVAT